jgi:phenylalanyl-tRNA synthetase alpha chain
MTILGAGMVHPVVLATAGSTGAVPGLRLRHGPERISMLRHRINDLRLFLENDCRFLASSDERIR